MLEAALLAETIPETVLPASERTDLATALAHRPPPAVRLRPGVGNETLPVPSTPIPWFERGRLLASRDRPGGWLPYGAGAYYIQDAASMLTLALAAPEGRLATTTAGKVGPRVCDLCAAPGGKSTGLAEVLPDNGWLLANEPIRSRVDVLAMNLARHGSTRHVITSADPDRLAGSLAGTFDLVVVDAPCSGQSMLAEGKQSVSAFLSSTVSHAAARQRRILDAAATLASPGGRIVYATCTFAVEENEAVIATFLASHPGWRIEPEPGLLSWESPLLAGSYRLWPHRDACGGAFAVRIRSDGGSSNGDTRVTKERDTPEEPARTAPTPRGKASSRQAAKARRGRHEETGGLPSEASDWGAWSEGSFVTRGACCYGLTEPPPEGWVEAMVAGPEVAFLKGRTWFPSYALALRRDRLFRPARSVELSSAEAAAYLAGEAIATEPTGPRNHATGDDSARHGPSRESIRGWAVATWRKWPMGWVKSDQKWLKNHLPKSMSLRVDPRLLNEQS